MSGDHGVYTKRDKHRLQASQLCINAHVQQTVCMTWQETSTLLRRIRVHVADLDSPVYQHMRGEMMRKKNGLLG